MSEQIETGAKPVPDDEATEKTEPLTEEEAKDVVGGGPQGGGAQLTGWELDNQRNYLYPREIHGNGR